MPRHYKAWTNHEPIDLEADLNSISTYFEGRIEDIQAIYRRWKLPSLEDDDAEALLEQIARLLAEFALLCDAVPKRTLLQLRATVKKIAKCPAEFLGSVGTYDPEAVAQVYEAFCRGSPQRRLLLSQFECGDDGPPPAEEIARAAGQVLEEIAVQIESSSQIGGQTLVLQRNLVLDLAALFKNFGGTLNRSTRFNLNLPSSYSYHGPFHDFLDLVLPPVRLFALKAGFKLKSIRSLVIVPVKYQRDESVLPNRLFGKFESTKPERRPARVGNFFDIHSHLLTQRQN